ATLCARRPAARRYGQPLDREAEARRTPAATGWVVVAGSAGLPAEEDRSAIGRRLDAGEGAGHDAPAIAPVDAHRVETVLGVVGEPGQWHREQLVHAAVSVG